MATYTDDFNRATLGANWTATLNGGTWDINASVRARQSASTGTYRGLRYASGMDTADVDVTVVFRASAMGGGGVLVRAPQSGSASADIDGYAILAFPGDAFYIVRIDGGDDSGVGYGYTWGSASANTDYTLRITVQGTTVTGYVDGTQRFTFTDSTYTGGSGNRGVALLSYGNTNEWDSFSALDIVSGQTVTPGVLASTATVHSPVVSQSGGGQTVTPNAIASGATVYSPTVRETQVVRPAPAQGTEYALRFYGNATGQIDRVRIPLEDGASTQYPVNVGAGPFTYEAWIRCAYADNTTTATDARYSNIIFDRDDWGQQRGHVWGVTRSGGNLVVCFGQAGAGGTWSTIIGTTNVGDNAWHHVAITRNQSSGVVAIWVDGTSNGSATYDTTDWSFPAGRTNPLGQDNEYIVLGTEKHDVGFGYNGSLDELHIWASVRYFTSFTPQRRVTVDIDDTYGMYRFDTGSGTVVYDDAVTTGAPTNGELLVGGTPSGPVWVEAATGAIGGTATVHAPTVTRSTTVQPNAIASTATVHAPTAQRGAVTVVPGALTSGAVVHAPTAQPGAVSVVPGAIAAGATVHAPSAIPGAVSVVPGAVASTSTVHAPTAQPGAVTVVPGTLASTATVHEPTAQNVNAVVVAGAIVSTATVHAPTAQPGAVAVVPGTIAAGAVVHAPTAQPGATTVQPNPVASGAVVHEPYIGGGSIVSPDPVASTSTVHAPTIVPGAVTVAVSTVGSVAVVRDPTAQPGAVTVAVGAIASTATVHAPYIGGGTVVSPSPIVSGAVVHGVTVVAGAVVVVPDATGNGATVHSVTVSATVTVQPGAIASGAVVHAPNVSADQTVTPGAIASGAVVHEPVIGGGAVVTPSPIVSGAVVHAPSAIPGAVSVAVSAVSSVAVVHDPLTAPGAVSVAVGAIAGASVVHEPYIGTGAVIAPALITSGAVVHEPTIQPGGVLVAPGTIVSGAVVHEPEFGFGTRQYVTAGAIESESAVLSVALVVVVASRSYRIPSDDRSYIVAEQNRTITVEE